jgi:hypothetical protein
MAPTKIQCLHCPAKIDSRRVNLVLKKNFIFSTIHILANVKRQSLIHATFAEKDFQRQKVFRYIKVNIIQQMNVVLNLNAGMFYILSIDLFCLKMISF